MDTNYLDNDYANLAKITMADVADYFPDIVYQQLPSVLSDSCKVFNDPRERDIFLIGNLVALGGCFHNLYAYNTVDEKRIAPNLFAFVVAPPASGKRSLQYGLKMIEGVKQQFNLHGILEPSHDTKRLLIPANISQAGMIELLKNNKGVGIMFESEIDTLVNVGKQDWGNYSDIIRNSFENERYSMYRKGDKKLVEIEALKLSIAMSGTGSQFKNLMVSIDNGLFSRGCYYTFDNSEAELKSFGRMRSEVDLDVKFASFASIVSHCYSTALKFEMIKVNFSEEQMTNIQSALQVLFDLIFENEIRNFEANVKRAFSIALKIATILSFLEKCESGNIDSEIECSEKSLTTAVVMSLVFLRHGAKVYDSMLVNSPVSLNDSQQRLFNSLPSEFSKDTALSIAENIGLKERTAYNAVNGLENKGLIALQADGTYKKQG